jgi:predicted metalloprotease with PDZ domain
MNRIRIAAIVMLVGSITGPLAGGVLAQDKQDKAPPPPPPKAVDDKVPPPPPPPPPPMKSTEKLLPPKGQYARLGVAYQMVPGGAMISDVIKDSPAWKAGLEKGTMIVRVDGYPVGVINGNVFSLASEIRRARGTATLEVLDPRTQKLSEKKVLLAEK